MNFEEELRLRTDNVQKIIEKYLPKAEGFQKTVLEAMNYSMLAGGKRLRPILMQETYRMFGGKREVIEPFMAAMEMIHTHSLIHDDLPAIDNDEYRRGQKTTWVVYGEAMGVLAGDGLLNYAYETACKAFALEPENRKSACGSGRKNGCLRNAGRTVYRCGSRRKSAVQRKAGLYLPPEDRGADRGGYDGRGDPCRSR